MTDKEFNLLDENWVRVITPDCKIREVSLTDAILHSHEYSDLCGELPTQNVAVMRLLLAVLHTVFSRVDKDGNPAPIEDEDEAFERWKSLWDLKQFPEKPIRSYLETQREKFWLFHPERPFYQVPEAKIGTKYGAAKLNGELSESSNKIRLFTTYSGKQKSVLSYPEAARWLITIHAFDDSSVKPKRKKREGEKSAGVGWMGKTGPITAKGNNLFQTLMLNLVMLNEGNKPWGEEKPSWEKKADSRESVEILLPDNLSELYTLQSRRVFLQRENGKVIGYNLLSGSFFEKEKAYIEQMTIWSSVKVSTKDKSEISFRPCRHDSTKQMWREFPSTFISGGEVRIPGIVRWVSVLKYDDYLKESQIVKFSICSAQYDSKNASVTDVFSDSLSFHRGLLEEAEEGWRNAISDEIGNCDKLATAVYYLAKDLDSAMGESEGESYKAAKEQLYFRIDVPFRNWLESIDSEWGTDKAEEDRERWRKTAQKIAVALGEEMVANAGEDAFTGRIIKEEGKSAKFYSSSKALLDFKYNVRKIYN